MSRSLYSYYHAIKYNQPTKKKTELKIFQKLVIKIRSNWLCIYTHVYIYKMVQINVWAIVTSHFMYLVC